VPVHDIPPGGQVIGAAVLVLEVVGVLPDVVAEDRIVALGKGESWLGVETTLSLPPAKMIQPTRSRTAWRCLIEALLDVSKSPKSALICSAMRPVARRDSVRADRAHEAPEGGVVQVAAALLRTAMRISSGTWAGRGPSRRRIGGQLGWLARAAFRL